MDGLEVLQRLKASNETLPVVIISGHGTSAPRSKPPSAARFDFIEKPLGSERVLVTIQQCARPARLRDENTLAEARRRSAPPDGRRVAGAAAGAGTRSSARRRPTRPCCCSARAASARSSSRARFTATACAAASASSRSNCAAIPEELIESELFGHEKGSFTGATEKQIGKFEQADRGTIFLDEVGDMSPKTQAKVLRVLQEGEVERLGSARTIKVDVRVIAATNKDLEAGDREGQVSRGPLLPPERHSDPRAAAARSPRRHSGAGAALRRPLQPRQQPAAAALHAGGARVPAARALEGQRPRAEEHGRAADHHDARRHRSTSTTCRDIVRIESRNRRPADDEKERPGTLREFKESAERTFLVGKLRENNWNISKTAEVIGTPRSNLYKKLEQYGISQESDG